jgi:hypothetical protein
MPNKLTGIKSKIQSNWGGLDHYLSVHTINSGIADGDETRLSGKAGLKVLTADCSMVASGSESRSPN